MKVYYLVNRPGTGCSKMHLSYEDALTEAQRLATVNPGISFIILKAIKEVVVEFPAPIVKGVEE